MARTSEYKTNKAKIPKWLQRENSSALRVIATHAPEDFLRWAATELLYKRGESIKATEKDYLAEDKLAELLSEKDRLVGELRFKKCVLHLEKADLFGYVNQIICISELEKNYLSIRGRDGFFYVRPVGSPDVEVQEEYDIGALERDKALRHVLSRYEDVKNIRSNIDIVTELVDRYLEKVGMVYETTDRYGKPVVGRLTSLRMNKAYLYYNVTLFNSIDAVQVYRISAKKLYKREDLKTDSQTTYYHDKAANDWAKRLAAADRLGESETDKDAN